MADEPDLDLPQTLLVKAANDQAALAALATQSPPIADEILGLHAQQALEKALKAVLASHSIEYRFTHDIAYLVELLRQTGVEVPAEIDDGDVLTPWAASFRYEAPPADHRLDRDAAQSAAAAAAAVAWAQRMVRKA